MSSGSRRGTTAAFIGLGYGALLGALYLWKNSDAWPWLAVASCLAGGIVAVVAGRTIAHARGRVRTVLDVTVLGALPAWGLAYSHWAGEATCTVTNCMAGDAVFRPLAEPEAVGLVVLHLLVVLAYAVSRRRPGALRPFPEALVHAALVAGMVAHAVLAVHFARWLPAAVLFPPAFLPCAAASRRTPRLPCPRRTPPTARPPRNSPCRPTPASTRPPSPARSCSPPRCSACTRSCTRSGSAARTGRSPW